MQGPPGPPGQKGEAGVDGIPGSSGERGDPGLHENNLFVLQLTGYYIILISIITQTTAVLALHDLFAIFVGVPGRGFPGQPGLDGTKG